MSTSWFEQTRSTLESIELIDKAIVAELFDKQTYPSQSVMIDWKIKNLISNKQTKCLDALILLTDVDKQKKQELEILQGQKSFTAGRNPDVWINFYEKLKEIKDYHKKNNPISQPNNTVDFVRDKVFDIVNKPPEFSGEETNGKYVDMNILFQEFINLKLIDSEKLDYIEFLKTFDDFHKIEQPLKEKEFKKYKRYLANLVDYLSNFFAKVQPLTDNSLPMKQHQENFEKEWEQGTVRGWDKYEENNEMTQEEIEDNPLYCKYCKKIFKNENTHFNHLDGKKHKKAEKLYEKEQQKLAENGGEQEIQDSKKLNNQEDQLWSERRKQLAFLESQAIRYKELLGDIIEDTQNNVTKKQTQTSTQMENDVLEKEDEKLLEDSDDEQPIYNPKNLPLGWDGKPIPYWLYKLHGLGIEYKCEICGNYSYWGRRAFERHFSEWRHSYGMKCLKIPNTVHFKEITSIQDAFKLHQKLVSEQDYLKFKPEVEEQYEDSEGNLMNKKTYNDLKRQGLL